LTPASSVAVTLGKDGRLVVRPGMHVPGRHLEGTLRGSGLVVHSEPGSRAFTIEADQLDLALASLDGWAVEFGPDVRPLVGHAARRDEDQRRALAACRTLADRPEVAAARLQDYAPLAMLDPHQVIAVAAASHPDIKGLCLFDEQGLGKTVQALFAFDRSRELGLVDKAVVLAPKNMVLEWLHDLQRFFPGKYEAVAVTGTDREKRALLDGKADLYVTNFESALRLAPRIGDVLSHSGLLVVDESFFVKNRDAQRTAAVKRVRSMAARCLVLCGTPAPNSAIDLVEQFNIADLGAAFAGVKVPEDPQAARPVVAQAIATRGVYLRRLKVHALDLPGRTFNRVRVRLEPRQQALYDDAKSNLAKEVARLTDDEFSARRASFAARRMALLQICSNPAAVDPTYDRLPAKLGALDALLQDLIERRGEKVVIWSFFTRAINGIAARYARYSPVRIDGSVRDAADRREAVRKFQEEESCRLFIGNPAAAGAGLTLHSARHAVYESMSNQAAHYLQSLDRIHRRGQTREVTYHVLLADGTVEEAEYQRLLRKEAAAQDLLGDEVVEPLTREAFLEELLNEQSASMEDSHSLAG
jgi:SNF2 family DNA or RNA helicase